MRLALILLVMTFSVAGFAKSEKKTAKKPVSRTISSAIESLPCEKEVLNLLGELEVPEKWHEMPDDFAAPAQVFFSRTTDPGVTLEVGLDASQTKVVRRTPRKATSYHFAVAKGCVPSVAVFAEKKRPTTKGAEPFGDMHFLELLEKSENSKRVQIIYLWSPRMELSIKGVKEIRKVIADFNADLTVVVESLSPEKEVRDLALKNHFSLADRRPLDSKYLISKSALLHFPNLMVLKDGKFISLRPGYDDPERLHEFLTTQAARK